MTRRFLGIPEPVWRVLLAGSVAAIWLLVFWSLPAWANDCAAYVANPSNFTGNLQGLIEDCMRTGSVQAITTILVGGIGGGAIAVAVQKGLQDAVNKAKDGVPGQGKAGDPGPAKAGVAGLGTIGDPGAGTTGDPGQGKADDPGTGSGGLPEAPPPTTGRDSVPETCRGLWDDYNTATREEFQKGKDVNTVNEWYIHVVQNHMNNLAKVTIQLGMDAADLASAGVGGIKSGAGIAKAVSNLGENLANIQKALARAVAHSSGLETFIYNLAVEIGTLMQKGGRLAGTASEAGRLSAKAESRIADLVKEAAHFEGQIGKYDELVRFAKSVDSTLLERNAASKVLAEAKTALDAANQEHQKILNRKKTLNDWAAAERAAIENEDARAFNTKHEELGNARDKLATQAAKDAEAAKAAHAEWQGKMNELSAAKKELETARAAAAHLQKARQELLMAEQEVRQAKVVGEEARTQLSHAESELTSLEGLLEEAERAKAAVQRRELDLERVTKRLETANAKMRAALDDLAKLEEQIATWDGLKAKCDQATAARVKARADMTDLDESPEMTGLQSRVDEAEAPLRAAEVRENDAYGELHRIGAEQKELRRQLSDELEGLGLDPDNMDIGNLPPDREAWYGRQEADLAGQWQKATIEKQNAQAAVASAKAEAQPKVAALKQRHAQMLKKRTQLEAVRDAAAIDESDAWTAYRDETGLTGPDAHDRVVDPMREKAKEMWDGSNRPEDPESVISLETEKQRVETDLADKQHEAAQKHVDKERHPALKQDVADAQRDVDHTTKLQQNAEKRRATAESDLKAADLSGTGEPLDSLHTLEGRQARYNELVSEQEALRVKYEALKSGGNHPEAAALKSRIEVLEVELAKWKSPDFETEAARRNPAKYGEWKAEQGAPDRVGEFQSQISTLQTRINELQAHLATVERKLSDEQQQAGGKSTAELEAERDKIKAELSTKQSEMTAAKDEKATQEKAKTDAEQQKKENDATVEKKEAEKRKAEEDKRKSDEEVARYKQMQDNPVARPDDASWLGGNVVGPMLGNKWTPYHGSTAEEIAAASHAARQKLDGALDAMTPDWLTAPFRWAGSKAGELFHKAFGGQSPEEVTAALKHGDQRVKEMKAKLKQVQDEFDILQKKAHEAKTALDTCVARNQKPAGSSP